MSSPKPRAIPLWQKSTTERLEIPSVVQVDDPVYSQAEPASEVSLDTTSTVPASQASSAKVIDDPVYSQAEAEPSSSIAKSSLDTTPLTNLARNDDPVYSQAVAAGDPSSITNPVQNDDPVYSQAEAASEASSEANTSTTASTPSAVMRNDDPVYSQAEAASRTSVRSNETSRASLLESASKFLRHKDFLDAPIERKTAFLEEKGLTREEINDILQTQNTMIPSASTATSQATTPSTIPPIITYPEFLSHAHQPKPLVTRTRILNAVYATGLLSGTLYIASKYLFEPMAEQMGIARHELFDTAQKGTKELNQKLEKVISVVPHQPALTAAGDDIESVASDPDELFHRDIGVQTSPKLEDDTSSNASSSSSESTSTTTRHASRLTDIKAHLSALSESSEDVLEEDEATRSVVRDLQTYLEELAHGGKRPTFSWEQGYGVTPVAKDEKLDEIARFKSEIRSVKGVLLSARNFPGSGAGGGILATGGRR
jgi:hypothetical protein